MIRESSHVHDFMSHMSGIDYPPLTLRGGVWKWELEALRKTKRHDESSSCSRVTSMRGAQFELSSQREFRLELPVLKESEGECISVEILLKLGLIKTIEKHKLSSLGGGGMRLAPSLNVQWHFLKDPNWRRHGQAWKEKGWHHF
jgi:hypothetical protein